MAARPRAIAIALSCAIAFTSDPSAGQEATFGHSRAARHPMPVDSVLWDSADEVAERRVVDYNELRRSVRAVSDSRMNGGPKIPGQVTGQAAERPRNQVADTLQGAFERVNPLVTNITILEVRVLGDHMGDDRSEVTYIVLARGVKEDLHEPRGDWTEELFGVFRMDYSMEQVIEELGVWRTPRWLDYRVWLESVSSEEVVVAGEGHTYEDDPRRWVFELAKRE